MVIYYYYYYYQPNQYGLTYNFYINQVNPNDTVSYTIPLYFRAAGIYKFIYHCEVKYLEEDIHDTICWALKSLLINAKDFRSV